MTSDRASGVETIDAHGHTRTVYRMTNPFETSIPTARLLADIPDYAPAHALAAADEALQRAATDALRDVAARRGRRGNPAIRDQALKDLRVAYDLRLEAQERHRRWEEPPPLTPTSSPCLTNAELDIETAPDLGPSQWAIIAANAPAWTGTAAELYMVAQATWPDESPLDLRAWRRESRRRRSHERLESAQWALQHEILQIKAHLEAVDRATRYVQVAQERAAHRMEQLAVLHQVAVLNDDDLAAYESALRDQGSPTAALNEVRRHGCAATT
jgi:hypothetical protein